MNEYKGQSEQLKEVPFVKVKPFFMHNCTQRLIVLHEITGREKVGNAVDYSQAAAL